MPKLPKPSSRRDLPRLFALAVSSAFLLAAGIPNEAFRFGFAPLGFLALVPLYVAVLESPGYGAGAILVGAFGAFAHALSSYWLWFFNDYRFWTLGTTTIAYFVVYSVLGLYLRLFETRSGRLRPLAFALLWGAFEYNKSVGFLGYPWGLLPYSLTDVLPLLQIADTTGVYGISAFLALSNAAVAEILIAIGRTPLAAIADRPRITRILPLQRASRIGYAGVAIFLAIAAGAYGLARMSVPIAQIGSIDAVLVQQNIDPWESGEDRAIAANIRLARDAIAGDAIAGDAGARAPELIMFSETTLRRPYEDFFRYFTERPVDSPLVPFIRETGAWVLTGAPIILDWDKYEATNSVILIDPSARQVQDYAKMHPVPFAEAVPFWEYPWFRGFMQEVVGYPGGWIMGTEHTVFELPTAGGVVRFGAPICFEDAFSEVCRGYFEAGADLLVNLTNDSWSKTVSAEIQHWAAARFRSIEYRRTLVRSTNGGFSCVVGPYGELIDSLPLFEARAVRTEIPIYKDENETAYMVYGNWFALGSLLLCAVWAIILMTAHSIRVVRERRSAP